MKVATSIGYNRNSYGSYRLSVVLQTKNSVYEVQDGTGTMNHLRTAQLRTVPWSDVEAQANAALGYLQPLAIIDMDEDDIAHLGSSRIHPNELAAFRQKWNE